MAFFPLRIPRTSKPPLGTPIDWSNPLAQGLVGVLAFNEGGGGTVWNSLGKSFPLVISGLGGLNNNGFETTLNSFNYVDLGQEVSWTHLTDFTLSFDFIPKDRGYRVLISKGHYAASAGWYVENEFESIRFYAGTTQVGSNVPVTTGVKVNITFTQKNGVLCCYKDGVLKSTTSGYSIVNTANNLRIGDYADTGYASNAIFIDVSYFSRALSASEVANQSTNPWQIYEPETVWVDLGAAAGDQSLTPALFSNSQSFPAPSIGIGAVNLTPSLVTSSNVFYSPTVVRGSINLTPSLVTNSSTIYTATVGRGAVTLQPSLFTNAATFYSPVVNAGGLTLTPSLYSNASTFYVPVVEPGAVSLQPGLTTNTTTFYAPVVSAGGSALAPTLFSNSSTFYTTSVGRGSVGLAPTLFNNASTFYTPSVGRGSVGLAPTLFNNASTFYAPTVGLAGSSALYPGLFINPSSFYSPHVSPGAVTLVPGLFANGSTFYIPIVGSSVGLSPQLFSSTNTFFIPAVGREAVNLTPDTFINVWQVYAVMISGGNAPMQSFGFTLQSEKRGFALPSEIKGFTL